MKKEGGGQCFFYDKAKLFVVLNCDDLQQCHPVEDVDVFGKKVKDQIGFKDLGSH